jgi:hypothetical protein
MSIKAVCECGKKFQAKDEYEGRRAICPSCRREFVFQRDGLPVFHEVIEPLPIEIDVEKPEPVKTSAPSRRFWNDPVVVFGWGTPVLALLAFFGYVAWQHAPAMHPATHVQDVGIIGRTPEARPYTIFETVIGFGGTRRSVDVMLDRKVSIEELERISREIEAADTVPREDTLLWYYLPGKGPVTKPSQTWAKASFRVKYGDGLAIMGLTIEEEKLLRNEPLSVPIGSEALGSWLSERFQCRYTIYRTGDNWFLQHVNGNWQLGEHAIPPRTFPPWVQELEQLPVSEGLAFLPRGSSERWLVDPKGILRMVNSNGTVFGKPDPIDLPLTAVKD